MQYFKFAVTLLSVTALGGCTATSNMLNPFYEPPSETALLGERNDRALYDGGGSDDSARKALEAMASYRQSHTPPPQYPVLQPAVVRVMWVPDHLNKNGDLVPAHYYYLKVLADRWAVQDAFELEGQLNGPKGQDDSSAIPYVLDGDQVQ